MCLIKKYLDNYIATTEETRQSHALVEGGGCKGSVLVERAWVMEVLALMGFSSYGTVQFGQIVLLCFSIDAFIFHERTNRMILFILSLKG
jgi:hypothetical protein